MVFSLYVDITAQGELYDSVTFKYVLLIKAYLHVFLKLSIKAYLQCTCILKICLIKNKWYSFAL